MRSAAHPGSAWDGTRALTRGLTTSPTAPMLCPQYAWDTRCDRWSSQYLLLVYASLPCSPLWALLRHCDNLVDGRLHRLFPSHIGGQLMGGVPE